MYSGHPAASSGSGYVAPNSGPSDRFDPAALVVPAVCAFLQKNPFGFTLFRFGSSEVPPATVIELSGELGQTQP